MRSKTAVIYARVSTARQADNELPIDSQLQQCHVKCSELGAEVVRVFTDPGISGREESRPGFQQAIAYCEEHGTDYFVTWSTSRFARDHIVAGLYKRRLKKRNVQLVYCTVDLDRETPGGLVLDGILALIDEHYSNQISADTLRSLIKNAQDGYSNGGRVPYGYQRVPSPKNSRRRSLQPQPEEAWLVGEIFNWASTGMGARSISGRLNASGYTARGRRWSASTVALLLRNPTVIGMITFNRRDGNSGDLKPREQWVQVMAHDPIVRQDIWDIVQGRIDASQPTNAGSPMSTFLFTGIMKCAYCGGGMQMETAKGRTRRYSYYNCATWLKTRQCQSHRRAATEMDEWLINTIVDKVFTPATLAEVARDLNAECGRWAVEKKEKLRALEAELADANRRKSRLYEVLELHGREAPNLSDLSERLHALTQRARTLANQIADLDAQSAPEFGSSSAEIEAISATLRSLVTDVTDVRRTRALLKNLLESVVVESDQVEIFYQTSLLAEGGKQRVVHSSKNWLGD